MNMFAFLSDYGSQNAGAYARAGGNDKELNNARRQALPAWSATSEGKGEPARGTPLGGPLALFWFRPISAAGFGLMRIGFGLTALLTFFQQLPSIERFYGPSGIISQEIVQEVARAQWRFSLLDSVPPEMTVPLFWLLIAGLVLVTLGIWTRGALLLSVILLYSFHEYAHITLDGGDTLMRLIGFILLLSPCDRAMSLSNLRRRFRISTKTGNDQPPIERTMPIWPYRLLLWQMIILYVSSSIEKLSGETWLSGSALAIVFHHEHFTRLTPQLADLFSSLSPILTYFTVITQGAWILLLIAPAFVKRGFLPEGITDALKRSLMVCGLLIHGGILLLMDVGTFSLTVLAAYFGLLHDNDFRAIRSLFNRKHSERVIVLFDGRCGFCTKTIIVLRSFDWLHRLEFANFHDPKLKEQYAPAIDTKSLNEAMHVRSNGAFTKDFSGFRTLAWHLPALWPLAPLLSIPGIPFIGHVVYQIVARHRA